MKRTSYGEYGRMEMGQEYTVRADFGEARIKKGAAEEVHDEPVEKEAKATRTTKEDSTATTRKTK